MEKSLWRAACTTVICSCRRTHVRLSSLTRSCGRIGEDVDYSRASNPIWRGGMDVRFDAAVNGRVCGTSSITRPRGNANVESLKRVRIGLARSDEISPEQPATLREGVERWEDSLRWLQEKRSRRSTRVFSSEWLVRDAFPGHAASPAASNLFTDQLRGSSPHPVVLLGVCRCAASGRMPGARSQVAPRLRTMR